MKTSHLKKFPLGRSNFKNVIEGNYYFADKSMFIHHVIEDENEVLLFPRPRRFGKTLNISMLRYFFEKTKTSNAHLFESLTIRKQETWTHQGQYPVIFLTLKDVKGETWEECLKKLKRIVSKEFSRHCYLLDNNFLQPNEESDFLSILNKDADQSVYEFALKDLSEYLYRYHSQKVIILCDEYDSPIHDGYFNNYYDKVIGFMRIFLGSAYKDNEYLFKGVMTGILRIARESIFSDLNNIDVYTILSDNFSEYFGITRAEVQQVLIDYDLSDHREIISQTYDGYHFGNNIIYNPWSVTHYFANPNAGPVPYWMNTSSNLFIKQLIFEQRFLKISEVQDLIDGKLVWKALNENIVMKDLKMFRDAVWSLLLFNGYLTAIDKRPSPNNPRKIEYCLKIPNVEVLNYFHLEMEAMIVNTHLSDILPLEKQHAKTLFISYNHKDIAFVKRLKNDLVQANIPLIIDIDSMKFGDDIREFIERSVKESDITLSVISENSLKSPWVMLETLETFLRENFEEKLRYIPVMIDDCFFRDSFYSELTEKVEKSIDQIVNEINILSKKYLPTDALDIKKKRLLILRANIDQIFVRLEENLVANFITEQQYFENFPQLIRLISQ